MKIIYRKGDLLESGLRFIAHGVNCQGVMQSGIAKSIKEKYPKAYQDYRDVHNTDKGILPGMVIASEHKDGVVFNLATQYKYGRVPTVQYVSYDAVRACIKQLNKIFATDTVVEIGFPKIGAGLGNGKWETIAAIIEEESKNFQPVVYELD